jgi:hypothetical protein
VTVAARQLLVWAGFVLGQPGKGKWRCRFQGAGAVQHAEEQAGDGERQHHVPHAPTSSRW